MKKIDHRCKYLRATSVAFTALSVLFGNVTNTINLQFTNARNNDRLRTGGWSCSIHYFCICLKPKSCQWHVLVWKRLCYSKATYRDGNYIMLSKDFACNGQKGDPSVVPTICAVTPIEDDYNCCILPRSRDSFFTKCLWAYVAKKTRCFIHIFIFVQEWHLRLTFCHLLGPWQLSSPHPLTESCQDFWRWYYTKCLMLLSASCNHTRGI